MPDYVNSSGSTGAWSLFRRRDAHAPTRVHRRWKRHDAFGTSTRAFHPASRSNLLDRKEPRTMHLPKHNWVHRIAIFSASVSASGAIVPLARRVCQAGFRITCVSCGKCENGTTQPRTAPTMKISCGFAPGSNTVEHAKINQTPAVVDSIRPENRNCISYRSNDQTSTLKNALTRVRRRQGDTIEPGRTICLSRNGQCRDLCREGARCRTAARRYRHHGQSLKPQGTARARND